MGQKVYIVSQTEYSNILGIFTNVRQCRKYILTLTDKENILLHEIRLNEPEKGKIDMTKLLYQTQNCQLPNDSLSSNDVIIVEGISK